MGGSSRGKQTDRASGRVVHPHRAHRPGRHGGPDR
nr:MAG TPA: hypothetical protein [Caudoviricetes sp.]